MPVAKKKEKGQPKQKLLLQAFLAKPVADGAITGHEKVGKK